MVLPDLKNAAKEVSYSVVDALAALGKDGSLLLSIVSRRTAGPVRLEVELNGVTPDGNVELLTLAAETPWAANTMEAPEAIKPVMSRAVLHGGKFELELRPYTWLRARIPR